MVLDGESVEGVVARGSVPGLVILGSLPVAGDTDVLAALFQTFAFVVEAPELRFRQGVFGSPYFLHSYLQISDPTAVGLVDYVLYGQASINLDDEFHVATKETIIDF